MNVYAGLDGGSTYLKAALIDERGRVLRTHVTNTGIDNNGAAKKLLAQLMAEVGVNRVDYTMATGYSRKILEVADDLWHDCRIGAENCDADPEWEMKYFRNVRKQ